MTTPADDDYRRQIATIERRLKALEARAFVDAILHATLRASEVPELKLESLEPGLPVGPS